jgi:hypothetical protein
VEGVGNFQGPLWDIDRDSSRHQIQIEDQPRTGVLMRLPAPCSGAPHATMFCFYF